MVRNSVAVTHFIVCNLDTLIVLAAVNVVVDYRGYLYNVLLAVRLAPMRGKRLAVPHVVMYWF